MGATKRTTKDAKPAAAGVRTRRPRKAKPAAESRGLAAAEVGGVARAALGEPVAKIVRQVEADGGAVIGAYRDPLGGHGLVLASLPLAKVKPTPFQRDLSDPHADRLARAIDAVGRFLDPIVAVYDEKEGWWTPNGLHRTAALRRLGAKSVVALVVPEREVAYKILALNTEKAHTLREKALEVIRMARDLAPLGAKEVELSVSFEEPSFLTLGLCYEARPRFAGSTYHSVLKRTEAFLDQSLASAIAARTERAKRLLELDDAVAAAVKALEARGITSPYLKSFVVARVNPIRFSKTPMHPFDETFGKMLAAAKAFDSTKIRADHVARSGGPPAE